MENNNQIPVEIPLNPEYFRFFGCFRYFPIIFFSFILLIFLSTAPKSETLRCDKIMNNCSVSRENFIGAKSIEHKVKFEDISGVMVHNYSVKVSSKSRRSSYSFPDDLKTPPQKETRYSVIFTLKDEKRSLIFAGYKKKSKAEQEAHAIYKLLKDTQSNKFVYKSKFAPLFR